MGRFGRQAEKEGASEVYLSIGKEPLFGGGAKTWARNSEGRQEGVDCVPGSSGYRKPPSAASSTSVATVQPLAVRRALAA